MPYRFTPLLAILIISVLLAGENGTAAEIFTQKPTIEATAIRAAKPAEVAKPAKDVAGGPDVQWIWTKGDHGFFRKDFVVGDVKKAILKVTCDNSFVAMVNGKKVSRGTEWQQPITVDVTKALMSGKNVLLIEGTNEDRGGLAGLAAKLSITDKDDKLSFIVTDKSWKAAPSGDAADGAAVRVLGKMGVGPWGNVFATAGRPGVAGGGGKFNTLPGYQVELLYSVPKGSQGSWVSIAFDNKGRLIASDQGGKGLFRITPPKIGTDEVTKVQKVPAKISSAQGMLYAFDSLYVSVNGGPGSGFYRVRDTNGDDTLDSVEKLKSLQGGGEHGPHSLRLSPDGKSIYAIAGNHTGPPELAGSRIPTNWSEDHLLPRQWDARGHARGKLAPGGWICKTDPDGKNWEMFTMGYRNPFDFDFNDDGEIFAYDADMEWDLGAPWYRPTRVVHATSGSEFGWRSGTGKWPTYYVDSLPPIVDIGPGSPVGATFGRGAKFPAKYQKAFFILDWTFGTIYAIHSEAEGASYKATKEEFLSRTPLPLTDTAIGPDGALYFTIGGRGANSALYRVTYTGKESTVPVSGKDTKFAALRKTRRDLEAFHGRVDAKAVAAALPYLSHSDRYIRYAARIAIEAQPVATWQSQALAQTSPDSLIQAMVALARQGKPEVQSDILKALDRLDFKSLSTRQQTDLMRTYALVFVRLGKPDQATAAALANKFDPFFPSKDNNLNAELSRVLIYLGGRTVIDKTLALMNSTVEEEIVDISELLARNGGYGGTISRILANHPDLRKLNFAFMLRNMQYGWTLEQRKAYFEWLNQFQSKQGGASYGGFINNIRNDALAKVSAAEKKALASTTIAPPPKLSELPKAKGPGKKWTLSDVIGVGSELTGRDFENGKKMFAAARCSTCHRFAGEGGSTGPDLSNVAGRFNVHDLSEAIVDPSKVISDQYQATSILTEDGKVFSGRIIGEADGVLTIQTDAVDATKLATVKADNIETKTPSKVSLMPTGLLDTLNVEEVKDMLAYLLSRGNAEDQMFAK